MLGTGDIMVSKKDKRHLPYLCVSSTVYTQHSASHKESSWQINEIIYLEIFPNFFLNSETFSSKKILHESLIYQINGRGQGKKVDTNF